MRKFEESPPLRDTIEEYNMEAIMIAENSNTCTRCRIPQSESAFESRRHKIRRACNAAKAFAEEEAKAAGIPLRELANGELHDDFNYNYIGHYLLDPRDKKAIKPADPDIIKAETEFPENVVIEFEVVAKKLNRPASKQFNDTLLPQLLCRDSIDAAGDRYFTEAGIKKPDELGQTQNAEYWNQHLNHMVEVLDVDPRDLYNQIYTIEYREALESVIGWDKFKKTHHAAKSPKLSTDEMLELSRVQQHRFRAPLRNEFEGSNDLVTYEALIAAGKVDEATEFFKTHRIHLVIAAPATNCDTGTTDAGIMTLAQLPESEIERIGKNAKHANWTQATKAGLSYRKVAEKRSLTGRALIRKFHEELVNVLCDECGGLIRLDDHSCYICTECGLDFSAEAPEAQFNEIVDYDPDLVDQPSGIILAYESYNAQSNVSEILGSDDDTAQMEYDESPQENSGDDVEEDRHPSQEQTHENKKEKRTSMRRRLQSDHIKRRIVTAIRDGKRVSTTDIEEALDIPRSTILDMCNELEAENKIICHKRGELGRPSIYKMKPVYKGKKAKKKVKGVRLANIKAEDQPLVDESAITSQ